VRPSPGADLVIPALALGFAAYFFISIADLAWEAKANGIVIGGVLVVLIAAQLVRSAVPLLRGRASLRFDALWEPRDALPKRVGMVLVTITFIATLNWLGLTLGLALALFAALWIMGQPFGFMAFLGVASLVGVIVSHVIVLFDFIEEAHERGAPLREALLDAGIVRLRPVMITVGATVLGLVPLAMHGGPLWEPLCYAQIGGLTLATFITLLLVPVLYAIFVLDLKLIRWGHSQSDDAAPALPSQPTSVAG